MGDGLLVASGMGVAAASAALPFFVAAHPDRFGPPEIAYDSVVVELAGAELIREQSDSERNQRAIIATPYDDVSVGTVDPSPDSEAFPEVGSGSSPAFSAFGTSNAFDDWQRDRVTSARRALAVQNGRAAIVDGGSVRMVRAGSILSDGNRVTSVRGERGSVVLIFENGQLERIPVEQTPEGMASQATRK